MITHVAIREGDTIYFLPKPNKHHHVLWHIFTIEGRKANSDATQGFLKDGVEFLTREEALVEAKKCGQLLERASHPGGRLYSEDVW